eukprot:6463925-Amphidinium_carterae.1
MQTLGAVKRAEPFPSHFVRFLEQLVCAECNIHLRYMAGLLLFNLMTRSRFSDSQRIVDEPTLQGDLMISRVRKYKTMRVKERRGLELPICALRVGLTELPWAEAFLKSRAALGVRAGPSVPFFPCLDEEGRPTKAAYTVQDGSRM